MTATFGQLKARARSRADMDGSQFVADAEFAQFVQDSAAELYDILVASFQDYYVSVTADTVVASGQDSITLPTDFYKLRGVDRNVGARWVSIDPFSFAERNDRVGSLAYDDSGVRYRVQGGVAKLTPADQCQGTYRVWYIPLMPALTLDADIFDDQNRWSDYVVVDAAIKALQKEESSTTQLERQKAALLKRIEDMAKSRDAGGPEVIVPQGRGAWWA